MTPLILASQSPRRKTLLERLNIPFTIQPAHVDEAVLPGEAPLDYVARVAKAKAAFVAAQNPGATILACDTPVIAQGRILQTPQNVEEAADMLRLQSGGRSYVPSVVVVQTPKGKVFSKTVNAWTKFKKISEAEIAAYLPSDEWKGVSGAFRIQGIAAAWMIDMKGTSSGIMGLPLYQTAQLLRRAGYKVLGE